MGEELNAAAERRALAIGFAGCMVMLSGAVTIVQGLWALDHESDTATKAAASQLSYANLETWGWIMLFWGIVAFFGSFAIFAGKQWGRWLGIILASMSLLLSTFWIFAFPLAAFSIIVIDISVIYVLFRYGGRDTSSV